MNANRRKNIYKIISELDTSKSKLECILDEEQYSFDNMPENLQGSFKASLSEDAIDLMQESIDLLNNVIENLYAIN